MSGQLLGKATVITGAGNGIGRATAELFAEEGARIVATDIDADALEPVCERLRAGGAEVAPFVGDVSSPADAKAMIEAARARRSGTRSWPSTVGACS